MLQRNVIVYGVSALFGNEIMAKHIARGALIIIEGVDRSGKTTQCAKLTKRLVSEGVKAELFKFPARESATGKLINEYLEQKSELDDHVIHLLFSANRWEAVADMKRMLLEGTTLIVDRYAFFGVAYSAAKLGMSLHWCMQPDVGLPQPDAVIFLSLDADAAVHRDSYGSERYENIAFQRRVADVFKQLKSPYWEWVDVTGRDIDDIHEQLHHLAVDVIQSVGNKELGHLWTDVIDNLTTDSGS